MTAPESGSARPGRVAGVALLGVAAVALVIGLITVFGGNGDGRADGNDEEQPPRPTASSSTTASPAPSTSSRPPATSSSRPPTSSSAPAPTTSSPRPSGGDGNGESTKATPVRVYNNSTIKGLAARAADDLKADGWQVAEVGNYSAGTIPTTTVYYRPGTDEEAAARAIAADFGMRVEERFAGIQDAHDGVIVIVTNDYKVANGKNDK